MPDETNRRQMFVLYATKRGKREQITRERDRKLAEFWIGAEFYVKQGYKEFEIVEEFDYHSPEPWSVSIRSGPDDSYITVTSADGEEVTAAQAQGGDCYDCGGVPDISDLDARRIVACVNFCRGEKTEDLLRWGTYEERLRDYVDDAVQEALEAAER